MNPVFQSLFARITSSSDWEKLQNRDLKLKIRIFNCKSFKFWKFPSAELSKIQRAQFLLNTFEWMAEARELFLFRWAAYWHGGQITKTCYNSPLWRTPEIIFKRHTKVLKIYTYTKNPGLHKRKMTVFRKKKILFKISNAKEYERQLNYTPDD